MFKKWVPDLLLLPVAVYFIRLWAYVYGFAGPLSGEQYGVGCLVAAISIGAAAAIWGCP